MYSEGLLHSDQEKQSSQLKANRIEAFNTVASEPSDCQLLIVASAMYSVLLGITWAGLHTQFMTAEVSKLCQMS